ncbi:MAG: hypothetical protein GXP17_00290 [Gammaproteobacteria bacterium]|nr:hypothetical protein [Gammaproteobacteria bacterium]
MDKQKRGYHINSVDEETQLEVVCSVEKISKRYLIPTLEQLPETFSLHNTWFFTPATARNTSTNG